MEKGGCGVYFYWTGTTTCYNDWGLAEALITFSELLALWLLLLMARRLDIREIQIFGDSRVVIDTGIMRYQAYMLPTWFIGARGFGPSPLIFLPSLVSTSSGEQPGGR